MQFSVRSKLFDEADTLLSMIVASLNMRNRCPMRKPIIPGHLLLSTNSLFVHCRAQSQCASVVLLPLMHRAYLILKSQFVLLWLCLLVCVVVCGLLIKDYANGVCPDVAEQVAPAPNPECKRRLKLTDKLAAIALLLFVVSYIFLIFYKEDFAYYDDDVLTEFSLRGHAFAPPIWPDLGRFFPLADQEFNLLRFITRSPAGYHSLIAGQLIVLVLILFVVLHDFALRYRALIVSAVMLAPSFVISFSGFVYPERNVLFWLAVMLLCIQLYTKTRGTLYFVGCLVATHCALYYKETGVLLVVVYALGHLLLQVHAERKRQQWPWRKLDKENALPLAMLAVAGIYVVMFGAFMLPYGKFGYIAQHREDLRSVLLTCLKTDWLPVICVAVLAVRVRRFIADESELDTMWDALGAGALAYFVGIIGLRLSSGYYMAPVDFVACLYLARMSVVWLSKPTTMRVAVVAITATCVLLQSSSYSAFRVVERKNLITVKGQLASFLQQYGRTVRGGRVELLFPYASGFHLMGLSSYLRYRGILLDGQNGDTAATGPRFVIEGREDFPNGRCVAFRDYACIHSNAAGPGALIIVLPDDDVSMNELVKIGKGADLLLSVEPDVVSGGANSWLRRLHSISPEFSSRELPEHWLQLHVFKERS